MKLLTKETDYAVRALLNMSKDKASYKGAKNISKEENIPYQFLRRILKRLKENGYIRTREGINGGARLAAAPGNIKISDLIVLFQGDIRISSCMFKKKICSNKRKCILRKKIKKIEGIVIREFGNITIHNLQNKKGE